MRPGLPMRLTDFRVLTFDCYGTLIDWESGIWTGLQPLLARLATPMPRDGVLELFARHEAAQEAETPAMLYSDVLSAVHRRVAVALGVSASEGDDRRFGASVPDWPAFPDSAAALHYLKQHYQLVILSNVDHASFAGQPAAAGGGIRRGLYGGGCRLLQAGSRQFRFHAEAVGGAGRSRGGRFCIRRRVCFMIMCRRGRGGWLRPGSIGGMTRRGGGRRGRRRRGSMIFGLPGWRRWWTRIGRKAFFFEKKKQKTFIRWSPVKPW